MRNGGTVLESRTTQTLTVGAEGGNGFDVGVNVFVTTAFGFQAAFTHSSAEVSGFAGDYTDYIKYVSRPPPNYDPVEVTSTSSSPGRPPTGALTSTSFALGGVVRWSGAHGRVGGTVSGGLHVDRYSGHVQNPVYTQFVLGGHSTLFSTHHRLVMAVEESQRFWGPYVAADFHVGVGPRAGFFAGIRAMPGSTITIPLSADSLVDPSEDTWTPDIAAVQQVVGSQPMELPGMRWQFLAGVKAFVK